MISTKHFHFSSAHQVLMFISHAKKNMIKLRERAWKMHQNCGLSVQNTQPPTNNNTRIKFLWVCFSRRLWNNKSAREKHRNNSYGLTLISWCLLAFLMFRFLMRKKNEDKQIIDGRDHLVREMLKCENCIRVGSARLQRQHVDIIIF